MTRRRKHSARTYAEIIARQDGICACGCKEELGTDPRDFQFDHHIPLHLEGEDTPDNLRALLKRHHLTKTVKEHKLRAKMARIKERDGMRKPRMNARQKVLAKILERQ